MSEEQQGQQEPSQPAPPQSPPPAAPQGQIPGADKKMLAGLLAIFLGVFGVHKFILGYQKEGIIMAVIGGVGIVGTLIPFIGCLTVFGAVAMSIIGLIEGIMYLTKTDEEFVNTYITNKKPWF